MTNATFLSTAELNQYPTTSRPPHDIKDGDYLKTEIGWLLANGHLENCIDGGWQIPCINSDGNREIFRTSRRDETITTV